MCYYYIGLSQVYLVAEAGYLRLWQPIPCKKLIVFFIFYFIQSIRLIGCWSILVEKGLDKNKWTNPTLHFGQLILLIGNKTKKKGCYNCIVSNILIYIDLSIAGHRELWTMEQAIITVHSQTFTIVARLIWHYPFS